jgi:hypothetical protein
MMSVCSPFLVGNADVEASRLNRSKWRVRFILSFIILSFAAGMLGCGGEPSPQVVEEQKQKQQVVQEKMKQWMMEKKAAAKQGKR